MSLKHLRPVVLFSLLLLLALPLGAAEEDAAPAHSLPGGMSPLPEDLESRLRTLMRAAEKHRGLQARSPVPSGTIGEAALEKKMTEVLREELPPERLAALEVSLKAFGLLPEEMDFAAYYPRLLTSQVAGFYDPEGRYFALVRREGDQGMADETVIVHELTHALQDQHFDLRKLVSGDPLSDGETARVALVEGDATFTMMSYALKTDELDELTSIGAALRSWMKDSERFVSTMPDLPGGEELAKAPAWVRDSLLFSYFQGFAFCLEVRQRGGQRLLDKAFTTDPPRSSEQILHPEKWLGRRDDPVVLPWPDLSRALPGYRKAAEGELGEASLRTLLRETARAGEKAADAAAGWGGDRFAVYEKDGRRVLLWLTEWDTEADAAEFRAAIEALGDTWRVESLGPKRVQVTRGGLSEDERGAVRGALGAPASRRPTH
ncbi:MAG TPA: hypothetical protein VE685_13700 [Thermoanaerobaculia bacterium]|nr:hypothetical protein [Thermoanaerobaculia bacterium]